MKTCLLFLMLVFVTSQRVKVVYLSEHPAQVEGLKTYRKTAKDFLDRAEMLLKEAEKELIEMAASQDYNRVEIFLLEKQHGEIPTESQLGRKGYVKLIYCFKN
jgi:hypothetical protein